jgi:hypothetical protein
MRSKTYVSVGPCEKRDCLAEAEAVDHHDACQRAADATRLQNNYTNGKYGELKLYTACCDTASTQYHAQRRTQKQQLEPHRTSAYGRLITCCAI